MSVASAALTRKTAAWAPSAGSAIPPNMNATTAPTETAEQNSNGTGPTADAKREAWKSIGRARSIATRPSLRSALMFHSANQVMSVPSRNETSR